MMFFFFFQAEDGIRDLTVTGVQTCALPISRERQLADRERDVAARARSLEREARDQARAYLLEARKTVEQALAQARAAVDEATAKEARRLVENAIEETEAREAGKGKGETWMSLEEL